MEVKDEDHPKGDIEIEITGLRHGEKLYEELLLGNELIPTQHKRIFQAHEEGIPWTKIKSILDELNLAIQSRDQDLIRNIMMESSTDYSPTKEIHDLLHAHQNKDV